VNHHSRFESLTDDSLEQVSSGVTYANPIAAAEAAIASAGALNIVGMPSSGPTYYGKAGDILHGISRWLQRV
jgi:hypothetical protein